MSSDPVLAYLGRLMLHQGDVRADRGNSTLPWETRFAWLPRMLIVAFARLVPSGTRSIGSNIGWMTTADSTSPPPSATP